MAGLAIFLLWRRVASSSRPIFWLVTAGVLLRSVGGVLAFWMSYLGLPVARSLQIGRGLWVFALDATLYVQYAVTYAAGGLQSILLVNKTLPSPFYIQTLAAAMLCFGSVISVAVLLNVAAYLGCCAIILSFSEGTPRPVVFAIAALSLSPSAVVWSLQPLKDVTFLFLVVSFFGAARVWQQLWRGDASRRQLVHGIVWSLLLAALLYGISGIRWYFGAVILVAAVPFAVMTIAGASSRMAAAAVSLLMLPLSLAAFFAAAGPYIPPSIRNAVSAHSLKEHAAVPRLVLRTVIESRRGFDKVGGATTIGAGRAIREIDAALASPAPPAAQVVAKAPKPPVTISPKQPADLAAAAVVPVAAQVVAKAAKPPVTISPKQPADLPTAAAVVPVAAQVATTAKPPVTPAAATPVAPPAAAAVATEPMPSPRSPARNVTPQRAQPAVAVPVSSLARILAGTAAIVLPQSLALRLGIVDVRGGQGLWLFVEVDTVIFDIVLGFALFSIAVAVRRRTLVAPLFWMMLFVTVAVGLALVYTVSNFGTLFRHRDMILVGLVLLPLAAGPAVRLKDASA